MSTYRCGNCDAVFDTQKAVQGIVALQDHAASDCPNCGGDRSSSRALMPHHLVVDAKGRATPDPKVKHIPAVPMAAEDNARLTALVQQLQGQLEEQNKRQAEIEASLNRLAKQPAVRTAAADVVEPPAVGEAHMAEAVKTVEAPQPQK